MSDKDSQEDNKLTANRQTLQLKKSGDAGPVRPNLAPARGKTTVVVEHKRKLVRKDKPAGEVPAAAAAPAPSFDSSILKPRKPEVRPEPVQAPAEPAASAPVVPPVVQPVVQPVVPPVVSAPAVVSEPVTPPVVSAPVAAPVVSAPPVVKAPPAPPVVSAPVVRAPAVRAPAAAPSAPAAAPAQQPSKGRGSQPYNKSQQRKSSADDGARLTLGERETRLRALESAKRVQEDMRRQEAENARRYAEEKARRDAEDLAAQEARRRRDEEARRKQEDEDRLKQAEARAHAAEEAPVVIQQPKSEAGAEQRPARGGEQRPAPRGDQRPDQRGPRPAGAGAGRPDQAGARGPSAPRPGAPSAPPAQVGEISKRVGPGGRTFGPDDEEGERRRGAGAGAGRPGGVNRPVTRTVREDPRKGAAKMTVTRALTDDGEGPRPRSLAALRRAREKEKRLMRAEMLPVKIVRDVTIPERITVQELANRMAERAVDVIRALMKMDVMATINDFLDADTAELIVAEFGHKAKRVSESDVEIGIGGEPDRAEDLRTRAPVVAVMGHVDHGKTSLLDALRTTNVVSGESGGITQHIGAYQVALPNGQKITFLDTPGHEAFTAMRSRGAKVTDIVVLVVAADDGVMPQTIEAINHAKAAEVPMIIAINKIDKPGAKPERIRQELLQHGIVVEEMSGDVLDVEISAKERINLDKLTDAIMLQAELLELKADPDRSAEGVVIEAQLDRGRGPVATVLVKRGTLRIGDVLVAGCEWGKVRALLDEHGQRIEEAGPSQPVVVLGLNGTPSAGDDFAVVENEARGREIADFRSRQRDTKRQGVRSSLETMFERLKETKAQSLPLLLKGDVQGSVEAIVSSLMKLNTDEVAARVVHSGVGAITETDVTLAKASNAPILAFNVRANAQARDMAEREGIEIRNYSVIYDLINDIKAAMSGLLAPERRETILGMAEVLQVFQAGKTGKAAGGLVLEGTIRSGAKARLLRDDVVIYDGELGSLRRFKDEVKEVRSGVECGMSFVNYTDLKPGDKIEVYEVTEIKRSL